MVEAKQVLQKLRGIEDVSGEMALLVEGLAVGIEPSIEEYIIGPANEHTEDQELTTYKDHIKLYGPEKGFSWVAKPVTGQSSLALVSRQGSMVQQSVPLMDPLVTLFGSVHEKLRDTGSMRSMLFPNFGSMISTMDPHVKDDHWDEEGLQREGDDYPSDGGAYSDDNLRSPLISRQTTAVETVVPPSHGSTLSVRRHSSLIQGNAGNWWWLAVGMEMV